MCIWRWAIGYSCVQAKLIEQMGTCQHCCDAFAVTPTGRVEDGCITSAAEHAPQVQGSQDFIGLTCRA